MCKNLIFQKTKKINADLWQIALFETVTAPVWYTDYVPLLAAEAARSGAAPVAPPYATVALLGQTRMLV